MDDFDERLSAEVRKHRRLYDNACPSRKNSKTTIATWKAIGNAVHEDPTLCMRRWKALRDKFVRLKKRIKNKKLSPGYEGAKVEVNAIHEKLSWLNEHVTHRNITEKREKVKLDVNHLGSAPITDMEQSSEAMQSDPEEGDELDGRRSKRKVMDNADIADGVKRLDVLENPAERPNQDACDRYTQTVADFMRGLSRRRCVVFKKRLNDLMYEMDLEELDDFAQS